MVNGYFDIVLHQQNLVLVADFDADASARHLVRSNVRPLRLILLGT